MLKPKTKAKPTACRMNEFLNLTPEEDEEIQHLKQTKHSPEHLRELPNSMETKPSLDPCEQKSGGYIMPTSISLHGYVCHDGIAEPSFTSEAESTQTTTKDASNDLNQNNHLVSTVSSCTESQNHTNGKSELVTGQTCTISHSSEDSHEHDNLSALNIIQEVGSFSQLPQKTQPGMLFISISGSILNSISNHGTH